MKGRVVALDRIDGRAAAALIVDGRLEDFLIDPAGEDPLQPGAIARALPDRPAKGLGGLFVRLPGGRTGFLRAPGGAPGTSPGRGMIVQVSGVAEAGKAVPVTQRVLFKGRLAIVTPGAGAMNVSRRIRDEALRARLAATATAVMAGADADMGVILRSAAEDAPAAEIEAELGQLRVLAEAVMADTEGGPELLLDAPDAQEIAWREWSDPAPDAVEEGRFAELGVFEMLTDALAPEVALPNGAGMIIEATRALVAVDVNTGADTTPAAGLKANMAAARALPRALRLRGLGGQVVVDFAPMPKRDRASVDQVLRAVFRNDATETSLAGWTALGLYELQRKRERTPLAQLLANGLD
jgi:ribonuclease G